MQAIIPLKSALGVTFLIKNMKSYILTQIKVYLLLQEVSVLSLSLYIQTQPKEQLGPWCTLR